jgi:Xaa-Pro aminopeptidase
MKINRLIAVIILLGFLAVPQKAQAPYEKLVYNYPYKDGIPFSRYKERRRNILPFMSAKSFALVLSPDYYTQIQEFYREDIVNSNLFYFTGLPQQKAVLLLIPGTYQYNGVNCNDLLFLQEQSKKDIIWNGLDVNLFDAEGMFGITKALYLPRMEGIIDELMLMRDTLYLADFPLTQTEGVLPGENPDIKLDLITKLKAKYPRLVVKLGIPGSKSLREIKDDDEIRLMKMAAEISGVGFRETMRVAKPGMTEYELKALVEYNFKRLGAEGPGYPSIVAGGKNSIFIHDTYSRDLIPDGSLVIMDCGARYNGYTADVTRTFPINGKFSKEQKKIYNIVLEAQDSALTVCTKENSFLSPHAQATSVIQRGLLELGIISKAYDARDYFTHATSHYLGIDVHDVGTYGNLKPGNVITVEPGIYIPEGSPCDPKWWNICVRIEDDVLITEGEPVVLTKNLPREAGDIEDLIGR